MKNTQINLREKSVQIRKYNFLERQGITNGDGIAHVFDGAGKRILITAFAGSINSQDAHSTKTPNHRRGVEYNEIQEGSLGTNTKAIEAKLRATKKKLRYIEPEAHRHGGKRKGAGRKLILNTLYGKYGRRPNEILF